MHLDPSCDSVQPVSDWVAARHVVLVMCPRCPVSMAGYAGMCSSDLPAFSSIAQPNTCIWIPPDSAAGEQLRCCPPCGVCYESSLPRCVMLAGYASMCPSDLPALISSIALPHTCIWIPPVSAAGE